jgi:predicted MFS family arabinose efflux permease
VFVVGPVAATLLATGVAPSAGLVIPLVAMIVGGYWFCALKATEPPVASKDQPRPRGSVLRTPAMFVLVLVFVAMGSIFGANDVATVAFADEAGHKNMAGPVLAVFAAGSLVSGLLYGTRHWKRPLHQRFANGMIALAIGVSLFFFVDSLWALAAVMFVTGFAIAPTIINGNALVQQLVPAERLTEGLTWVGTALGVGVSVGSSVAGVRIDAAGSHAGFLVVVVSAAVAVIAVLLSYRTLRGEHTGHVHDAVEDDPVSASAGAAVSATELAECVERDR